MQQKIINLSLDVHASAVTVLNHCTSLPSLHGAAGATPATELKKEKLFAHAAIPVVLSLCFAAGCTGLLGTARQACSCLQPQRGARAACTALHTSVGGQTLGSLQQLHVLWARRSVCE
jgi:hypothetical protein